MTNTRTMWQIGYERSDEFSSDERGAARVISMRTYPYRIAQKLVARLRRRGNDAYIAGSLKINKAK